MKKHIQQQDNQKKRNMFFSLHFKLASKKNANMALWSLVQKEINALTRLQGRAHEIIFRVFFYIFHERGKAIRL